MATFNGTAGIDNFVGTDPAADLFRFLPANLAATDTVSGGFGAVNDTLEFLAGGNISAASLAGVSGIEIVRLAGNSTIELTQNMFDTSRLGTITVFGSTGNDTVFAFNNGVFGGNSVFNANTGNDTYIGGTGADRVALATNALTFRDILIGGNGGGDNLQFTTAGAVASNAFNNVFGFETVTLNAGGNSITLVQSSVGSADGAFRVVGGNGDDTVDATPLTSGVNFNAGNGANTLFGGAGNDNAIGGTGIDNFSGGDGNDTLNGNGGIDSLNGGFGNNTLNGGEGDDTLIAFGGRTTHTGGGGADTIGVWSQDAPGLWDFIRYNAVTDGGGTGDQISGDLGYLIDGDLKFQFSTAAFSTLGNNFNFVYADDGSSATGPGGPSDGADLVLYNDGGAGLTTTAAVDTYFVLRYYESTVPGAFLLNYDNTTNVTTLYYDTDAYTGGTEVVVLAQIEGYNPANFALLGNDFSFVV